MILFIRITYFGLHLQIHVFGSWCYSGWQDTGMHSQAHVVEFVAAYRGKAVVYTRSHKCLGFGVSLKDKLREYIHKHM